MTNQSACRSGRYPGSYAERPASRPGRTAPGTGYPAPQTGHSTSQFPIGMTYTPMQSWENLYCPSQALKQGTLFIDLDKPFTGRRVNR